MTNLTLNNPALQEVIKLIPSSEFKKISLIQYLSSQTITKTENTVFFKKSNQLARKKLEKGKSSQTKGNKEDAAKYFNEGLALLEDSCWDKTYNLSVELHIEAARAEGALASYDQLLLLVEIASKYTKTIIEKAVVQELKIQAFIAQNKMQMAIETGLEILTELGIKLIDKHPKQSAEELAINPRTPNRKQLAALRILKAITTATYIAQPELLPSLVFTMVDMCAKYGNSPLSIYAYAIDAVLLVGPLGKIESGYQFGKLSLRLLKEFSSNEFSAIAINGFGGYIKHWKDSITETFELLKEAVQTGLEIGDLEFTSYAAVNYCTNYVLAGNENLETISGLYCSYLEIVKKCNQGYTIFYGKIWWQFVFNLTSENKEKTQLKGEIFDETESLPILLKLKNYTSIFCFYLVKTILALLFDKPFQAVSSAKEAEQYSQAATGFFSVAVFNFYYSLALLAHYPQALPAEQLQMRQQVEANQQQMAKWAYHAPMNFKHKHDLVEAERARLAGDCRRAGALYRDAIRGARDNSYLQEEALANELAGRFYLAQLNRGMAEDLLRQAYYLYLEWRAMAKVEQLEAQYPFLRTAQREQLENDINTGFKDYFILNVNYIGGSRQLDWRVSPLRSALSKDIEWG